METVSHLDGMHASRVPSRPETRLSPDPSLMKRKDDSFHLLCLFHYLRGQSCRPFPRDVLPILTSTALRAFPSNLVTTSSSKRSACYPGSNFAPQVHTFGLLEKVSITKRHLRKLWPSNQNKTISNAHKHICLLIFPFIFIINLIIVF